MKTFICSLIALAVSLGTTSTALAKKDTKTQINKTTRKVATDESAKTAISEAAFAIAKKEIVTAKVYGDINEKNLSNGAITLEDGGCKNSADNKHLICQLVATYTESSGKLIFQYDLKVNNFKNLTTADDAP